MGLTNTPSEHSDPNHTGRSGARSTPQAAPNLPCDVITELIPAYSLGATDPEETFAVQSQLAACPPALAELTRYNRLAEGLLHGVPLQQAPPAVANRLRAALGAPASRPAPPFKIPTLYTLVPPAVARPPRRRWSFSRGLATAAGLLLLVLNGILLVQNQELRAAQARLDAELNQQNRALIFLAADEPKQVLLPAAQENSIAQADVLWNESKGIAILCARDFPSLPPDQVYQLWLNKDGQRTSAGLFTVDEEGRGVLVFPIEQAIDAYDRMGITQEPAGGSPGPTGPAVVRGPV